MAYDVELTRTLDRLRGMALSRLDAPYAPEPTRVVAVRAIAQELADSAAALAGDGWRDVPCVSAPATVELLAITGHDLRVAYDDPALEADTRAGGRTTAAVLLAEATSALRALRLRL